MSGFEKCRRKPLDAGAEELGVGQVTRDRPNKGVRQVRLAFEEAVEKAGRRVKQAGDAVGGKHLGS